MHVRIRIAARTTIRLAAVLLMCRGSAARATMPPASGHISPELSSAFARGLFEVEPQPAALATSAAPRLWSIPIIRVAFSDSAIVYPRVTLERQLFDTTGANLTGSMAQYYRWASRGRLELRGEVVATVTLAHDRNYYAADAWGVDALSTPNNSYGMFREAISACDGAVDFSRFDLDSDGYVDMLWVVHAGPGGESTTSRRDLWSITSRATAGWNNGAAVETNDFSPGSITQHVRIDRFTVLPELSSFRPGQPCEIGVFCHEFGHTLGLPDLYDTSQFGGAANVGPGIWSLMSSGAYGGDGRSPESPSHLGAWCLLSLGWANRLRPTLDTTLVLPPVIDGAPVLEFWFQGESSPEHFLIENRVREGFDRNLPNDGLLITQVDEAVVGSKLAGNRINTGPTPGLRVLEADGDFDMFSGANHGDPNDPFPGQRRRTRLDDLTTPSTRTFQGAPTNIALEDIGRSGRNALVRVNVRAAGWIAPSAISLGSEVLQSFSGARRAAVAPNGKAWLASCEPRDGRIAVVLRERPWQQPWQPPVAVDAGTGQVSDVTLAWLGGDDVAVAWIDGSTAARQVNYRARVSGRWLPVRVLTSSSEGCFAPAIAADARGRVFLSWLEIANGLPSLRFMQFLYTAPYGQPVTITTPVDLPSPPCVTAAGDGHAYVLWPDRGTGAQVVYACRFNPDSGLSARFRLAPSTPFPQPSVSAVVDANGVLHSVWQLSTGGGDEIHYQRRQPAGRPSLPDTTLEALGHGQQNPSLALDPEGGLHVAYERAVDAGQRVLYKRRRPDLGWDHRATEVSDAQDLNAGFIELLPTSWGNVTVVWTGFDGVTQPLRQRERRLDGNAVLGAPLPPPAPPAERLALAVGPVPLRAGQVLEFSGAALRMGDIVELIDPAGRHVVSAVADGGGQARLSPAATRDLPSGLYFARIHGREAHGRVVVLH